MKALCLSLVCILAVLIIAWPFAVAPQLLAMSTDFTYTANVISVDNLYDEVQQAFQGEKISDTVFQYSVSAVTGKVVILDILFDVRDQFGNQIVKVTRQYGIDRQTGQHDPKFGDRSREGHLFAPRHAQEGQSFLYWHPNYDMPITLEYQATEKLYGLEVYRYAADFQSDQTAVLVKQLPLVGTERGVAVATYLDIWFEPVTGYLVNYADSSEASFYDLNTGNTIAPWNSFRNKFSESAVIYHVTVAKDQKLGKLLIESIFPFTLIASGVVMIVFYSLLFSVYTQKWRPLFLGFLLFCTLGMLSTFCLLFLNEKSQNQETDFQVRAGQVHSGIVDRLETYQNALIAGRAFFTSSELVTRSDFQRFVENMGVYNQYPGISGYGYAEFVSTVGKEDYEQRLQEEGLRNSRVFPEGEREVYVPLTYFEPYTEAAKIGTGYDLYSEPNRREAILFALESGFPALTGKLQLLQTKKDAPLDKGFALYVPIYKPGTNPQSVEERRREIQGFMFAVFRVENFMRKTLADLSGDFNVELYDAAEESEMNEANLMYADIQSKATSGMVSIQKLSFGNHTYLIRYSELAQEQRQEKQITSLMLMLTVFGALFVVISITAIFAKKQC